MTTMEEKKKCRPCVKKLAERAARRGVLAGLFSLAVAGGLVRETGADLFGGLLVVALLVAAVAASHLLSVAWALSQMLAADDDEG